MGGQSRAGILKMNEQIRHMVIATAGHIDHGKTTLVRALTGMETDRLLEEKRRGITIELGFAFLGDNITIIDIPGHERFIKTMVAGVTTVDLVLLVIAADDAVMPQTREHLAILHLLGIPNLFVVLSKIAGQSPEWLDLVTADVRDILPASYRGSAQFFRCDSLSGEGVAELKEAIIAYARTLSPRDDSGIYRLPVDRAFTMKGHGTVVTGTVLSGKVAVGDHLQVMPMNAEVRVRGLQSHGQSKQQIGVGVRTAMNLIGADADRIQRGDWICARNTFLPIEVIDVSLVTLPSAPVLKNRDRIRFHLGTKEAIGRLILFGRDSVSPGESAYAQVILEEKIMAVRNDRFVFRRYSPLQTWGGGRVLDPVSQKKRRADISVLSSFERLEKIPESEALELKVHLSGTAGLSLARARAFMNVPECELAGQTHRLVEKGTILLFGTMESGVLLSADLTDAASEAILQKVNEFHREFPQLLGVKQASLISELTAQFHPQLLEEAIKALTGGKLLIEKGFVRRKDHIVHLDTDLETISSRVETVLKEAGFTPPAQEKLRKQLGLSSVELNRILNVMEQQDRIIRMGDGSPWATQSINSAWKIIQPIIAQGDGVTVSQMREALSCSRKSAIVLTEYFDSASLTERREDLRYPGPKFDEK